MALVNNGEAVFVGNTSDGLIIFGSPDAIENSDFELGPISTDPAARTRWSVMFAEECIARYKTGSISC